MSISKDLLKEQAKTLRKGMWAQERAASEPDIYGGGTSAPAGFVAHSDAYFIHPESNMLWHIKTGKLLAYDEECDNYYEEHEGENLENEISICAEGSATADASGKRVLIQDLHKVAIVLKKKIPHFDKPSSLFAIFDGEQAVATQSAKVLHSKLLNRLIEFKGQWSNERLQTALLAIVSELGCTSTALLLVFGKRLFVATSGIARCVLCLDNDSSALTCVAGQGLGSTVVTDSFQLCSSSTSAALLGGSFSSALGDEDVLSAFGPYAKKSRPHAGAVALIKTARQKALPEAIVAVAILRQRNLEGRNEIVNEAAKRPSPDDLAQDVRQTASALSMPPAKKRGIVRNCMFYRQGLCMKGKLCSYPHMSENGEDEELEKQQLQQEIEKQQKQDIAQKKTKAENSGKSIRVRHILVRHDGRQQSIDPVRRKTVKRSVEDAEALLLEVLAEMGNAPPVKVMSLQGKQWQGKFTKWVKQLSECETALKGGGFEGDLGWINPLEITQELPASLVKAASALEVGEVSDIVKSDLGLHLVMRCG